MVGASKTFHVNPLFLWERAGVRAERNQEDCPFTIHDPLR